MKIYLQLSTYVDLHFFGDPGVGMFKSKDTDPRKLISDKKTKLEKKTVTREIYNKILYMYIGVPIRKWIMSVGTVLKGCFHHSVES